MNNLKETYQHLGITCKHELNISDFKTLANDLSQKLHLNIEMVYDSSSILFDKTISINGVTEKVFLRERISLLIPEIKYELVQEEFRFIIYEDFIELRIKIPIDYSHLLLLKNEDQLTKIELFKKIINQLKILGIDKLHIFVFGEFELGENKNYCWKNVIPAINKCNNHFEIII
ncbi:hypothetical protein NHF50_04600 [Flavobacterium sp. NRK F10]|uniref:hypothetical protein n=1 Tax=Flavobacterium sp. NRK F10 TaxID=2954931 RepID=UPI002091B584|nr:hypothetical protein [Flavobacterium sp. NRK F10]MCO6174318.1 hypothetical protein [Flavobacterium sp. NRK F10]